MPSLPIKDFLYCNQSPERGCSMSPPEHDKAGLQGSLPCAGSPPRSAICCSLQIISKGEPECPHWRFSGGESTILSTMSNPASGREAPTPLALRDTSPKTPTPAPRFLRWQKAGPATLFSSHKPGSPCRSSPCHQVPVEMHGAAHLLFELQLQLLHRFQQTSSR